MHRGFVEGKLRKPGVPPGACHVFRPYTHRYYTPHHPAQPRHMGYHFQLPRRVQETMRLEHFLE